MAQLEHIEAIEKRLWSAADTLRANSNYASNEYFLPVMGWFFCAMHTAVFLESKMPSWQTCAECCLKVNIRNSTMPCLGSCCVRFNPEATQLVAIIKKNFEALGVWARIFRKKVIFLVYQTDDGTLNLTSPNSVDF